MTRDRGGADFLQLVTVAVAALVGGLLAMLALFLTGPLQPEIMLFVVIVVALLAVLTVGTLQTSPQRSTPRPPWTPPMAPPPNAPPSGYPPFRPRPLPAPDSARYGEVAAAASPAAPLPRFTPPSVPEPPPLDTRPPAYEARRVPGAPSDRVRRIVQCPTCGDFEIDMRQAGDELSFGCRNRGHHWTWAPGRPWPTTVVRPPPHLSTTPTLSDRPPP